MSILLKSQGESLSIATSSTSEISYSFTYNVTGNESFSTSSEGLIVTATDTEVIAAPAPGYFYEITAGTLVNIGVAANIVQINKVVLGVDYPQMSADVTLEANYSIEYSSIGFRVFDANGNEILSIPALSDGTQKTQIVDAGGDAVTVTGSRLDVNANVDTSLLATEATLLNVLSEVSNTVTTSTISSVASSLASVPILALNANRKGATIYNDSIQTLFLKLGPAATSSSFTVKIGPSGYYELPHPIYTGVIDGLWDLVEGNARVTELT